MNAPPAAAAPRRRAELPEALLRLAPWRFAAAWLFDATLIAASFAAAMAWPHPLMWLAAALLIARSQLGLAVLMHDAAHGLLARSRRWNDILGQLATAAPLFLSLHAYRRGHLQHHRAPMAADDPVARVFGIADYPVPRRELARRLLKDVTGWAYFATLASLARGGRQAPPVPRPAGSRANEIAFVAASIAGVNLAIFGALAALGHPWLYLGLWIVPALTLLQLLARLRAIAEHAGYGESDDQTRNARSVLGPAWQTFFVGPHGVHFHIEHHEHVRAPFYRLRDVHRHMQAAGRLPAENLFRGYGQVLRDVSFPTPRTPAH